MTDKPREEDVAQAIHAAEFDRGEEWWNAADHDAPWKLKYRKMARAAIALWDNNEQYEDGFAAGIAIERMRCRQTQLLEQIAKNTARK